MQTNITERGLKVLTLAIKAILAIVVLALVISLVSAFASGINKTLKESRLPGTGTGTTDGMQQQVQQTAPIPPAQNDAQPETTSIPPSEIAARDRQNIDELPMPQARSEPSGKAANDDTARLADNEITISIGAPPSGAPVRLAVTGTAPPSTEPTSVMTDERAPIAGDSSERSPIRPPQTTVTKVTDPNLRRPQQVPPRDGTSRDQSIRSPKPRNSKDSRNTSGQRQSPTRGNTEAQNNNGTGQRGQPSGNRGSQGERRINR